MTLEFVEEREGEPNRDRGLSTVISIPVSTTGPRPSTPTLSDSTPRDSGPRERVSGPRRLDPNAFVYRRRPWGVDGSGRPDPRGPRPFIPLSHRIRVPEGGTQDPPSRHEVSTPTYISEFR